jgi:hypothetical protein
MEELLPSIIPATNLRVRLNGKVSIALSQLDASKTTLSKSASWVVDSFADQSDLIAALTATDYIPCFTGRHTYTIFRNQPVIDGGYANGFEELSAAGRGGTGGDGCCEGCGEQSCLTSTVKVGSWHVGALGDPTCDPVRCKKSFAQSGCRSADRTDRVTRLYRVSCLIFRFLPPLSLSLSFLHTLTHTHKHNDTHTHTLPPTNQQQNNPYVDRWRLNQIADRCPEPSYDAGGDYVPGPFADLDPWKADADYPTFVPQNSVEPDIHPGKYNPLPEWQGRTLLACEWQAWATGLPKDGPDGPVETMRRAMELVYEQGYKDARSWLSLVKGVEIEESAE